MEDNPRFPTEADVLAEPPQRIRRLKRKRKREEKEPAISSGGRRRTRRRVEIGSGQGLRLALLLLALLSLLDRSQTAWMGVRALIFLLFPLLAKPTLPAVAASLGLVAWGGFGGFNLALAILAWSGFRFRLTALAQLGMAVGLAGALCLAISVFVPNWPIATFPFPNRNHYAVFIEVLFPLLVLQARRRNERWLYGVAALLVAAAVGAGSRTGAVLLAAEVLALGTYLLGWRRVWQLALPLGLLATIAFLASGVTRWAHPLAGDHRLEIWRSALDMIAAKPWTGWGGGNFPRYYPGFAYFDNSEFVNAAHSDWLEWSVEFGLPATFALLLLFVAAVRKSLRHPTSWGILMGALHAAVDFPGHMPGLLFVYACFAGALLSHGQETHQSSTSAG